MGRAQSKSYQVFSPYHIPLPTLFTSLPTPSHPSTPSSHLSTSLHVPIWQALDTSHRPCDAVRVDVTPGPMRPSGSAATIACESALTNGELLKVHVSLAGR